MVDGLNTYARQTSTERSGMSEHMVSTFCNMVKVDSESGEEARFIDYLKNLFAKELEANCAIDSYGNLIVRVSGKGTGKSEPVLLCSHGDTVIPGKGIEPIIKEGVIYSAGETILGADDKAGIAEILEAVRTAKRHPPIEIVITRGEETGLLGAKNLDLSMINAKIGFIVDGLELDTVVVGGPSHITLDIEIIGRTAHPAMEPGKGISAIRVAAKAIATMPEGRIDEETTASVGTFHGGTVRNAVSERVTIQAECRSLDHDKCVQQAEVMRRAFEKAAKEAEIKAKIDVNLEYHASQIPEQAPAVQFATAAIAAVGLKPKTKVIMGGSDAFILSEKGIESVVVGYGGKDVHSSQERIAVVDMERAVEILRHLLHSLG